MNNICFIAAHKVEPGAFCRGLYNALGIAINAIMLAPLDSDCRGVVMILLASITAKLAYSTKHNYYYSHQYVIKHYDAPFYDFDGKVNQTLFRHTDEGSLWLKQHNIEYEHTMLTWNKNARAIIMLGYVIDSGIIDNIPDNKFYERTLRRIVYDNKSHVLMPLFQLDKISGKYRLHHADEHVKVVTDTINDLLQMHNIQYSLPFKPIITHHFIVGDI